jgi:hypothetical protein
MQRHDHAGLHAPTDAEALDQAAHLAQTKEITFRAVSPPCGRFRALADARSAAVGAGFINRSINNRA